MRIMKNILCFVIGLFVFSACYDEGKLDPSETPELIYGKYTLPQGEHSYDDDIVAFYHEYESLLLYKFTSKDFGWSPTGNVSWDIKDTVTNPGRGLMWNSQPADTNYVGQQLELLYDKWFGYLSDTLMHMLPQKILLCSVIETLRAGLGYEPLPEERTPYNVYAGFYHIAVSWGNEKILTMTREERNQFKIDVCTAFFTSLANTLGRPDDFFFVSSYADDIAADQIYANGILDYNNRVSLDNDWLDYIEMAIANPLSSLEAEGGLLHESVDVNGKIREKYTIMVDFFKEVYDFDIQAIGNDVE